MPLASYRPRASGRLSTGSRKLDLDGVQDAEDDGEATRERGVRMRDLWSWITSRGISSNGMVITLWLVEL